LEEAGRPNQDIYFVCENCGAHGTYETSALAEMELTWTKKQKVAIEHEYRRTRIARCPLDQAILDIIPINEAGVLRQNFLACCPHCGRNFDSAELNAENDPETFEGQYEVIRPIGKGGMGSVDLVRHRSTGAVFAAKTILPVFLNDPQKVRRFQRETRIWSGLEHHRIVKVREIFLSERGGIILMDYMQGACLTARINDPKTPTPLLVEWFSQIVDGLRFLHQNGIVHRDLKPDNILLDGDSSAYISDFGLAMLLDRDSTTLTKTGAFVGTLHYAAPEQLLDAGAVDAKADIYALGLIAYEIATRASPYHVVNLSHLPAPLRDTLERATRRDRAERAISGEEISAALKSSLL
jgi:serine/threonine protein kinase